MSDNISPAFWLLVAEAWIAGENVSQNHHQVNGFELQGSTFTQLLRNASKEIIFEGLTYRYRCRHTLIEKFMWQEGYHPNKNPHAFRKQIMIFFMYVFMNSRYYITAEGENLAVNLNQNIHFKSICDLWNSM